jgi:4-hydroxyproline epimerase
MAVRRVRVIDSHTGGEPTRVVISGAPALGHGPMAERLLHFRAEHDDFRSAVVNEPRGSDAVVGALLCDPVDAANACGVFYFNNVGYLGMCGHGTIGLVVTLAHLGRIAPGTVRIETPVGVVSAEWHGANEVTVSNVASYRLAKDIEVDVEGFGRVRGDVAWGGNWFFISGGAPWPLDLKNIEPLTDYAWRVRQALTRGGITGADGAEIDHVELFGPPRTAGVDCRNFVLCPGKAYDRSPCGTGTSAKLACLAADGKLAPGREWSQESIVGSVFTGSYELRDGHLLPRIRGSAYVNSDAELLLDDNDPFCWGIRG